MSTVVEPQTAISGGSPQAEPAGGEGGGPRVSRNGEPTWEIVELFPRQGEWTVEDYLSLATDVSLELNDGRLELRPMPDPPHQLIVLFLARVMQDVLRRTGSPGGVVAIAPFSIQVRDHVVRQPDVAWLSPDRLKANHKPVRGADLVIEVVSASPEDRLRDYVTKRADYARAGVPEYWIVDPAERGITLLALVSGEQDEAEYREVGRFSAGGVVVSQKLAGFEVSVADCFAAGDEGAIAQPGDK